MPLPRLSPGQWAMAIIAALVVIYVPHLNNSFVSLDDTLLIVKNPIAHGMTLHNIKAAFTSYDPELYIPLTFLSYQWDYVLFGLNPIIFHFTNLLLHIGNVALVGWLAYALSGRRQLVAIACAALFALHPMQVEAVAWAAARKDLLSTFFFLLSFAGYLFYLEHEDHRFYWGSVAAFALALMAKVSVLMLPIVLLILLLTKNEVMNKRMIELIPFFALSVIFGIVALFGKQHLLVSTTLLEKMLMAGKSTATYLFKLFVPANLSVLYPQSDPISLTAIDFLLPTVVVIVLIAAIVALWKRWALGAFCLAFFLITLIPSFANFSKNGFLYFASDRYAYVPSIGIFLFVALGIAAMLDRKPQWQERTQPLTMAAGVVVVTFTVLSFAQAGVWKNDETLYTHVLSHYPQAAVAQNNLGTVHFERGELETALGYFNEAARLGPNFIEAHVNIGNVYKAQENYPLAIDAYRQAVAAIPEENLTPDDLLAYYFLGQMLEGTGQRTEALAQFEAAAQRGTDFAEPQYNLGVTYQKYGRLNDAAQQYRKTIRLDHGYTSAHYNLAALYAENGKLDDAVTELQIVLQQDPEHENAKRHLESIQKILGQRGGWEDVGTIEY